MRAEIASIADEIRQSIELLRRHLDWDQSTLRLSELNALASAPEFWEDPIKAQEIMRERTYLEKSLGDLSAFDRDLQDTIELIKLGEEEGDVNVVLDGERVLNDLLKKCAKNQLEALLSGELDSNDCYLEIHAGAGGTEAQDWAEMLLRMYVRWSDTRGFTIKYIEESAGDEAGLKSVTIRVSGQNAYGWLKTESGVHRLVRISPYDSAARRHTSFSSAWIYPVIDQSIDVKIEDKDLRVDTYRASGAGGQHVNKTNSAIRITHIPTGVVVQCQNDRSQHRNRATALDMLRARLYELEIRRKEESANVIEAQKSDIGWGHQIRSYVLQPYQLVKDLRTNEETSDTQGVLNGDIDRFLEASLSEKITAISAI
ncbi:MAG: peptide chain release factor 2 [Rhodospirillaceae bacterium]|nr:peptide chain release factor 2 [Rhodospirillaceae bacterium]MDG1275337.1 peptide chain release factor 2 [Alphaproteobacteria bacterium]MDG1885837.1 peptide chain release factor 2 [Alphaproteobacteria bacterium]